MKQKMLGQESGFTMDTCAVIKICENPNLGTMIGCRIDFENSTVYLNSQTVKEAQRFGFDFDILSSNIKSVLGANVVFGKITSEMLTEAWDLELQCPTLHPGDSEILSFAKNTNTTLISCDRGLLEAARISGADFVNLDLLPSNQLARRLGARCQKVLKDAIKNTSTSTSKLKISAKRPVKKIIWRAFT